MRKIIVLVLFLCCSVLWAQKSALLVVADDANMTENDVAVMERLESVHGLSVDTTNADIVDETWADGMSLVYVSSTITSTTLDQKIKNVEVPIFMVESYALDNNGMSYDNDSTRYSSTFQRDIIITAPEHYLAAGLQGEVAIYDEYETLPGMQGLPNENGTLIAEYAEWEEGELPCLGAEFAYEKGAVMADTTEAAERRLFFGLHDTGFLLLTESGMKMWDAAVSWLLYMDENSAVESNAIQPHEFMVLQNYPNPFNPMTTITYELESSSNVTLDVFNTLGEKVASLVNETQHAGQYTVPFDASNLPSGIYLYQLKSSERVLTKKMVLAR